VQANKKAHSKRMESVEKTMKRGVSATLGNVVTCWRACFLRSQQKLKSELQVMKHVTSANKVLLGKVLMDWAHEAALDLTSVKARFAGSQENSVFGGEFAGDMGFGGDVQNGAQGGQAARKNVGRRTGKELSTMVSYYRGWLSLVVLRKNAEARKAGMIKEIMGDQTHHMETAFRAWEGAKLRQLLEKQVSEKELLKEQQARELQEIKENEKMARKYAMLKQFANSDRAGLEFAFHAWREIGHNLRHSRQHRDETRQRAEAAALRSMAANEQTLTAAVFMEWVRSAMRRKADERQELAKSSLQRQLLASRTTLLHQSITAWSTRASKAKSDRQRHDSVVARNLHRNTRTLLEEIVHGWAATKETQRLERARIELENTRALLKESQGNAEQARERRKMELAKHFRQSAEGLEKHCFMGWKNFLKNKRASAHNQAVGERMADKSKASLETEVFIAWWRQAIRQKSAASKERTRAGVARQLGNSVTVVLGSTWAGWQSFCEGQRRNKKRLQQSHAMAAKRMADLDEPLKMLALNALRHEMMEGRLQKAADSRCSSFKARALERDRSTGEQKAMWQDHGTMSRAYLGWRFMSSVSSVERLERKRLGRCATLGRSYAVKLRSRMQELRCIYSWLLATKTKQAVEKHKSDDGFLGDPPAFFVKPVMRSEPQGPAQLQLQDKVHHLRSTPRPRSAIAARSSSPTHGPVQHVEVEFAPEEFVEADQGEQAATAAAVAAAAAVSAPSSPQMRRESSPTRVTVRTAPANGTMSARDRYALASQAATSDGEYRRLLEQNRREIRENRLRRLLDGAFGRAEGCRSCHVTK